LVRGYTTLTFLVCVITLSLLSVLILIFLKDICYLLGSDDEVYPYVRTYLGILSGAVVFYIIPNFTEAFSRLAGKPNKVFTSGVICCVVNIVLDYFFIMRFGWGMAGAAVATCVANSTAAVVLAPNVRFGKVAGGWKEVGRIFYNGCSEMLNSVSAAIAMFMFNLVLMREIGSLGVAAMTIVYYINMVVNMSVYGLSQALYPLMSYELGARSYQRIKALLVISLKSSGAIGVAVFVLAQVFKHPLVSVFSDGNQELVSLAITAVSIVTTHYLLSFVNIIGSSFHTAVERPVESAAIALCRSLVFVSLPLLLLPRLIGDTGIWLSMPVAELLTLFVSLPLYIKTLRRLKLRLNG
ncbi:MAG: MATE family efflux transporter, partial [Candidatus Limimorpha sp.]